MTTATHRQIVAIGAFVNARELFGRAAWAASAIIKPKLVCMPTVGCPHHRTQLIAKDSEAHYVECLDCGAILEASEIDRTEQTQADKGTGFDESLSDA